MGNGYVYTTHSLATAGAKLGHTFIIALGLCYANVGKLKQCSFDNLVLWISLRLLYDLLYRLNCHVDKQPVVGDLFFAGLWIAGNRR